MKLCFQCGNIVIMQLCPADFCSEIPDIVGPFVVEEPPNVDIMLRVSLSDSFAPASNAICRIQTPGWSMSSISKGYSFDFYDQSSKKCIAKMETDCLYSDIDLAVLPEVFRQTVIPPPCILAVILISYLSVHKQGVLLHGSLHLSKRNNDGFALLGKSGVGKSTLSGILQNSGMTVKISDDRFIVRMDREEYTGSSLPIDWKESSAVNQSVELRHLIFLSHATDNRNTIRTLSSSEAFLLAIQCNYFPFHHSGFSRFYCEFIKSLVSGVECISYSFVPSDSAVEELLSNLRYPLS